MIILLFGAPGTGKSTYAKYLSETRNLPWISTGEIIRKMAETDPLVKETIEGGHFLPDVEVDRIVLQRLDETTGEFILDGFPRTLNQAQSFKNFLETKGWQIDRAFKLVVPVEAVVGRLKSRGRADDTEEVILERYNVYESKTAPVLTFLKDMGVQVTEIDNAPSVEVVKKEFDKELQ